MIWIKSWSSKCHKVTPVAQTLSSSLVIVAGEIARPFLPLKRLARGQAVPGRNKTVTERRMRSRVYQSGGRDERANERYSQAATGGSPD